MSSQWWKLARMEACVSGSAARKFPMVWSEKTTPQPKVSSGRFRSYTSIRTDGSALRSRMAAYSPAGPPPRHTIRLIWQFPSLQPYRQRAISLEWALSWAYVILPSTSGVNYSFAVISGKGPYEHCSPNLGPTGRRHRCRWDSRNRPDCPPGACNTGHPAATPLCELEAVRAPGNLALRRARTCLVL